MALSNKQQAFVNEYLVDFNATQAAIRAGYSVKTARQIGSKLLTKVDISTVVQAEIAERSMSADEVLLRLAEHARGDMGDFMAIGPLGFSLDLNGAKERGITHLIKKVKQKTTTFLSKNESDEDREVTETEIELYDAQAALVHLGRHHVLFTDKQEVAQRVYNVKLDGEDFEDEQ